MFFLLAILIAQQDQTPRPVTRVDPVYFDLAANTGGDFYIWAPGEFASAHLQVPLHHADVVLSYGSIEQKKSFEIPVESGVKELTVFAAVQRKDLAVLVRPDGTVVRDVQSFQHMLIATVKSPATGIWRLEIDGAGPHAVTAHVKPADDGPDLIRVGLEPDGLCTVSLSGSVKDTELVFVARDGSPISSVPITPVRAGEYAGECKAPEVPFRAAVGGKDATGAAFQRIESALRGSSKK